VSDWRKYSDQQWMRLQSELVRNPTHSASLRSSHRSASIAAPLGLLAVCLMTTTTLDVPWGGGLDLDQEEATMNWMGVSMGVCALTTCVANGQNLLINGGFEGAGGTCTQFFIGAGQSSIPGWVVSGSWPVDWVRTQDPSVIACYCPSEGNFAVDLNGSPNTVSGSALRQVVETLPGRRYELVVQAVSNPYATPVGTVKTLRVTTGSTVTDFFLVTGPGPELPFCDTGWPWEQKRVVFVATTAQTTVELRSTYPNSGGGIFVDDTRLVEVPCDGDVDASSSVDGVDLAIILQNWGTPSPKYPAADVTGDGQVDGADLAIVLSTWGPCP
jgi:hypothetical protein